MENMKAVQVHNCGGPEVLHFEDAPRPTPGSGELLIKVLAASVNAIDWKARAGYMKDVFPLPLPYIPGWDVSGIVEAIGPGVTQFRKGDEVYAVTDGGRSGKGTYAEYVVIKETEAALKPKSIDHIHAAAVVALTAWQAPPDLLISAAADSIRWNRVWPGGYAQAPPALFRISDTPPASRLPLWFQKLPCR